jgi:hypothetical protein
MSVLIEWLSCGMSPFKASCKIHDLLPNETRINICKQNGGCEL